MDSKDPRSAKSVFFDLELDPKRVALTRPSSLLRTTEWGGLTLVSLLVSLAFPPYFVQVLVLASLNAGGLLWVSHLNEVGRKRLREFEQEFSQGHQLEEQGRQAEALALYQSLLPRYSDFPKIADIAQKQIEKLTPLIMAKPIARRKRAKR